MQKELNKLEDEFSGERVRELEAYSSSALPRMLSLIGKNMKNVSGRKSVFKIMGRLARIAVAAVLILNMGISLAFFTIPSFKARLVSFLIETNHSHATLSFEEYGNGVLVPND